MARTAAQAPKRTKQTDSSTQKKKQTNVASHSRPGRPAHPGRPSNSEKKQTTSSTNSKTSSRGDSTHQARRHVNTKINTVNSSQKRPQRGVVDLSSSQPNVASASRMSTFADPYNTEAVERQKDFAREKAREEREKMAKRAMNSGMEIGRVKDDLHTTTGSCSTVYGDCVGDDAQIMDEFKDNHDNWDKTLSKNTPDAEQRTTTDSKTKQQFQTTYKADSSYQRPETHNPNIFTHTKRNFFTITSLFNFGKKMPYSTTSTNAALSDHQKINPQPSGPKFSEPTSSSTSTDSARAKTHMNGTSPGSKTGGANSTSANVDSKIRGVKTGTTVDIDAKTAAVSGSSIDFGEKGRNASPTSSGDLGEKDRTVTPTTSGNLGEKGRNANPTSSGDSNRTRDTHSTSSTVNSTSPTTVDSFARNVDTASINQGVHGTGKASKKG